MRSFAAELDVVLGDGPIGGGANSLIVAGAARFASTAGTSIRVGVDAGGANSSAITQFGSLTFAAGTIPADVFLFADGNMLLVGDNTARSLALGASGDVTDVDVNVSVNLDAQVVAGGNIRLATDDNGSSDGVLIDTWNVGGTLSLDAASGTVVAGSEDVLVGAGLGTVRASVLAVTAGTTATVDVDQAVQLADIDVGTWDLTAAGSVTQGRRRRARRLC